jgi:hypothetical protein
MMKVLFAETCWLNFTLGGNSFPTPSKSQDELTAAAHKMLAAHKRPSKFKTCTSAAEAALILLRLRRS